MSLARKPPINASLSLSPSLPQASDEDIKNAYKKLCIIFHPDKHTDSHDKIAAQTKFQAVQRAFDILSNPNKRYIYDLYGEEGLDQSWEISSDRLKTKEEVTSLHIW